MIAEEFEVPEGNRLILSLLVDILVVNESSEITYLAEEQFKLLLNYFFEERNKNWAASRVFLEQSHGLFEKRAKIYLDVDFLTSCFEEAVESLSAMFEIKLEGKYLISLNSKLLREANLQSLSNAFRLLGQIKKSERITHKASFYLSQGNLEEFCKDKLTEWNFSLENIGQAKSRPKHCLSASEFALFVNCVTLIAKGVLQRNVLVLLSKIKEMGLKKLHVRLLTEYLWNFLAFKGWEVASFFADKKAFYQIIILKILYAFPENELSSLKSQIELLEDHIFAGDFRLNVFTEEIHKPPAERIHFHFLSENVRGLRSSEHCQGILKLCADFRALVSFFEPKIIKRFESLVCLIFNWQSYFLVRERFASESLLERKAIVIATLENVIDALSFGSFSPNKQTAFVQALAIFEGLDLSIFAAVRAEEVVYKKAVFPLSFLFKILYSASKSELLHLKLAKSS